MAQFGNLEITNEEAARSWSAEVKRLNEETAALLVDVGKALVDVQQGADSTLVDEIVKYGNRIVSASNKILEGMNGLVSTVTTILSSINETIEKAKGIFKTVVNGLDQIF